MKRQSVQEPSPQSAELSRSPGISCEQIFCLLFQSAHDHDHFECAVLEKQAAEMYSQDADKVHAEAQTCLAECYEIGAGVAKDETKAAEFFANAGEQGHVGAQAILRSPKRRRL